MRSNVALRVGVYLPRARGPRDAALVIEQAGLSNRSYSACFGSSWYQAPLHVAHLDGSFSLLTLKRQGQSPGVLFWLCLCGALAVLTSIAATPSRLPGRSGNSPCHAQPSASALFSATAKSAMTWSAIPVTRRGRLQPNRRPRRAAWCWCLRASTMHQTQINIQAAAALMMSRCHTWMQWRVKE